MLHYADASWWMSFNVRQDVHHQAARGLFVRHPDAQVLWTPWHRVEVFNSLHQAERRGAIPQGEARHLIRTIEMEVRLGYWLHREFSWTDAMRHACLLARKHGASLPIRGMDLFHVAVALTVRAPVFLTFDGEQRALAGAAGLRVE